LPGRVKVITVGKKTHAVKPVLRSVGNLSLPISQIDTQSESGEFERESEIIQSNPGTSGPSSLPACNSVTSVSSPSNVNVLQLEEQCKNLEDDLDQVKFEIVKIVTDKNDVSKENAVLKTYQNAFASLIEQNEILKRRVQEMSLNEAIGQHFQLDQERYSPMMSYSGTKEGKIPEIDRTSPDGQEKDSDQQVNCKSDMNLEEEILKLKEFVAETEKSRKKETETLELEKNDLRERNKQLEESLELMSEEFESMEDYWQNKLVGERKFYEQQLKISESQFKELEIRLKEYDVELSNIDMNKVEETDKLSTIDETSSLEYQVQEWEEEIAQLRLDLDNQEKSFKKQISDLEVIWNKKLKDMEQENNEIKEKYSVLKLKLENTHSYKICSEREKKPENRGQTDLEKLWQKSKSNTGFPSFIPHTPPEERPMSLPTELVSDARKEVRRLQELRHYIQEECDQLLLKKDRLKEKMILDDIAREKSLVEQEIKISQSDSFDQILLDSLNQKLSNQVTRCKMLHEALARQRTQFQNILDNTKKQHQAQVLELESLIASSKDVLRQQTIKIKEQVDKLVMSDTIIEQLIVDNDQLTTKLINLKQSL